MVFIKSFQAFGDRILIIPRFRDQHAEGMSKGFAGKYQEFKNIVERSRITFLRFDHREDLFQIFADNAGFHERFACIHPHPVALDGIDLPVMAQITERLGQIPGGKSIGREP